MLFISVSEFKARTGASTLDVVTSPKTGKVFVAASTGNYKAQASLDPKLPIRFMYESDTLFDKGCFTNVSDSDNIKFSL